MPITIKQNAQAYRDEEGNYINFDMIKDSGGDAPIGDFMNKNNPTGTGSFSLNRKENTEIGTNSVAMGVGSEASGEYSFACGAGATASGPYSFAIGSGTGATGPNAHAEGGGSYATAAQAHAEGGGTTASGSNSHAEGTGTIASGSNSHAEGGGSQAKGENSHAEGFGAIATAKGQHVEGILNIEDTIGKYAHIIGNGTVEGNTVKRANIHTVDWNGNAWYAGNIEVSDVIIIKEDSTTISLVDLARRLEALEQSGGALAAAEENEF